jgi:hypothetical protein
MLRRRIKILQQRLKRREVKIKNMKDLIATLRAKVKDCEALLEVLQSNFAGFPLHVLLHKITNKNRSKFNYVYSDKMKEFALTLYFYSPKAYTYLREQSFGLPNPSTLRRWVSKFNCSPGFLNEVFQFLKANVDDKPYLKDVSLVFDAMSIRKQILYDQKEGKNIGYVDLGGVNVDNQEDLATEALVFQVVSLRGHFKCTIGYFYINKISSSVLSQLLKMAVYKLKESGVNVQNITFDGASSNISAVNKLGCKLPNKPFFRLSGFDYDITVTLDPPHMLKLCRNTLADKKVIESPDGVVQYKFIESLNVFQKKEGLRLANKLSEKHIAFKNRKMNVKIAAQTLSSSVANAIEFLCKRNHPDFINSEPTVKFIRVIDNLFDYLNSRDPYGRGPKGPIKLKNKEKDDKMLADAFDYLSKLVVEGVNILEHPRKTFALGFMGDIISIKMLRDRLLVTNDFKYLLSYKLSQDHIELLFSCIRSRCGHNDNPNVQQFKWALRKLMFRHSVRPSENANCADLEPNSIQSSVLDLSVDLSTQIQLGSVDSDSFEDNSFDHDIEIVSEMVDGLQKSYYKDNMIYYICGFIVKKVTLKLKCEECCNLLLADDSDLSVYTHFTDFLSKGGLLRVSEDVFKLVKFIYKLVVVQSAFNFNAHQIINKTCNHFRGSIFTNHVSNNCFDELNHATMLIKLVGGLFLRIIGNHRAKEATSIANLPRLGLRQKLTKLILFSNV